MKNFLSFFGILTIGLVGSIGLTEAGSKGTSGAQFLRIGVGARGPGMAGAISPIVNDATAIYYNPAGMALMEKREVTLSYNEYFEDTSSQFLGYSHPSENHGTFGVGISAFGVQDIDRRSATGGDADIPDLGSFDTQDMALSVGWAHKSEWGRGRLNYGLALKYISSDLETQSGRTGALDMGVIYNFGQDSQFFTSLGILNLGFDIKYDQDSDPLPLNVKPGVGWRTDVGRLGHMALTVDSDLLLNDGLVFVQPGLEWQIHQVLALRTGYQFGRDDGAGSGFAAGAGLNIANILFDYAFVPFGDLGDTHRAAFGYRF